jgi:hypothetical protein
MHMVPAAPRPEGESLAVLLGQFTRAWQAGEAVRVEEFLRRFPHLAEDAQAVMELIIAEFRGREGLGQRPSASEYLERFPQYHAQLQETPLDGGAATAAPGAPRPGLEAPPALDGRYRVERFLARGGMGEVYRVLDTAFNRPLALKVLQPQFAGHADVEERFLREARLTGRLQHPGVPPVQELGRLADGRPYFLMKLVQGRDLRALLQERVSPQEQLTYFLGVFEQVCRTVAYAHAQGILHRDLKPGNVMVGAFGEVQVMDWGLAKFVRDIPALAPATDATDPGTTVLHIQAPEMPAAASVAGEVIGTPAYMAPEQARGEIEQLDRTCDVFGLGGILCEILTGQPPFTGTKLEMQRQAMKGDLRDALGRLEKCGADAELMVLARCCLAPERVDRPPDADVVAQATAGHQERMRQRLRQAEIAQGQAQVRVEEERKRLLLERQKRRHTLFLAGAVLLVLCAGIIGTSVALVQAWEQTRRAEQAEEGARAEALAAEQQRARALAAEREAKGQAKLAEQQRLKAEAQTELARDKEREAKRQAQLAKKVKDTLVEAFRQPDPYLAGDKVTVAQVLKQAVAEVEKMEEPDQKEELLIAIGQTYLRLRSPEAAAVWEKIVALHTGQLGADHAATLASVTNLAWATRLRGERRRLCRCTRRSWPSAAPSLAPATPTRSSP